MAWNKLMQFIFGSTLMMAQTLPSKPVYSLATLNEMLSFECAKSVTGMLYPLDQTGPLFYDHGLVFTSIDTNASHPLLLVSAGTGIFSVPLEGAGVNRVRFTIPAQTNGETKTFYLSFLHGNQSRSRVFEFSEGRPPMGKDELDYNQLTPKRAENLLSHFEYAIYTTAEVNLAALTEGRLNRDQLKRHRAENCEHIQKNSPQLAQNLKRSLDVIEMIVLGPQIKDAGPVRMPASIAVRRSAAPPGEDD
jgi:hypothetical protein